MRTSTFNCEICNKLIHEGNPGTGIKYRDNGTGGFDFTATGFEESLKHLCAKCLVGISKLAKEYEKGTL